jgi:hypothetical protein
MWGTRRFVSGITRRLEVLRLEEYFLPIEKIQEGPLRPYDGNSHDQRRIDARVMRQAGSKYVGYVFEVE